MDIYYVYKHTFRNGTVYFGKGSNNRIYSNKRNRYWTSLYKKYGEPKREFLNTELPEKMAFLLEEGYIESSKKVGIKVCNISTGGEASASGYHHTKEAKRRISEKLKGRKLTEETKLRMSKSWKSRKYTSGKKLNKNLLPHTCNRRPVQQFTKTGTLLSTFISITEASKATGVNAGNISTVCNNKAKSAGTYCWKYKH